MADNDLSFNGYESMIHPVDFWAFSEINSQLIGWLIGSIQDAHDFSL